MNISASKTNISMLKLELKLNTLHFGCITKNIARIHLDCTPLIILFNVVKLHFAPLLYLLQRYFRKYFLMLFPSFCFENWFKLN